MEIKDITESLKKAREAKKRKFKQAVDVIFNLKDLDLKKPEHQVDVYVTLPVPNGKTLKIAALVDSDLEEDAKKVMDTTVLVDEFAKFAQDKKLTKKLASSHDYFIAEASVMAKVAQSFGRVLGPKGKMPNPKAGCVVPPKAQLKPLYDRLQNTVRLNGKLQPLIQIRVGNEETSDEDIAKNIKVCYDALSHALPNGEHNIRSSFVKLTMGSAVKLK